MEQAIVIGAVLAFLVLFFFLRSPRFPVIIGLTMPISILATFMAMYFLDIHLNVISLTGLALGIGMLGDNAIIVIENVTRLREQGKGLLEAALEGAEEINLAVTASTLTNVAIFLPIVFVEGVAQQLFVDMGVTMTISLLVSLLVAATLVPMLVSRTMSMNTQWLKPRQFLHGTSKSPVRFWLTLPFRLPAFLVIGLAASTLRFGSVLGRVVGPVFYNAVESVSRRAYVNVERLLRWLLTHRGLAMCATILLFAGSLVAAWFIPAEPAPDIDQSRFVVQLHLPKGTNLEATSAFAKRIEEGVLRLPGVRSVFASIGIPEEQSVQGVLDAAIERASVEVKVEETASTEEVVDKVRQFVESVRSSFAGVEFSIKRRGTTFEQILRPEPNDVKIRIVGRDTRMARHIAQEFLGHISDVEGLVDLRTSLQRGDPEYRFVVDRERVGRYGLSVQAVAQHLSQHVKGKEATYLSDFDRKVTIRVRSEAGVRESLDEILDTGILTSSGLVPVRELVKWEEREGEGEIWRENQQRAVIMVGNVSGRSLGSVVEELERKGSLISLPAGYSISIGGENEEIRESFRSLFIVLLLSLFLVYMILAAEYESILYPFVILLTSPLAFIGAIGAMWLTGQNYNVMSIIGLVIMIGAVDNDAVIVVDIITMLRREGRSLFEAILEGMRRRLRPILMTTATTVLGIIPLVFEFGTGSELVRALTAPLVGGLIASTFFTIVAIPIVYSYVDRWAIGRRKRS